MLKKIVFILSIVAVLSILAWGVYEVLFAPGSDELKDANVAYIEGELQDKAKVEAECTISEEDRFCFKDTVWAQKENSIEFEGFVLVEYTNESEIVTEVSTGTAKLENVSPGTLTIRATEPSERFLAPGESVSIRYSIAYDTKDEETNNKIKADGAEFMATLTNEIGKSLTELFIVEFRN